MIKQCHIVVIISLLLAGCTGTPPKLGLENGRLAPCPDSPNCVCSQAEADDKQHYIEPIIVTGSSLDARKRILEVVERMPRSEVVKQEDNYIRAAFTSLVFRFVDDVEFYFPETESETVTIHVRSASRLGYSDMGVNRERIENIRAKLEVVGRE